ncbi:MAG: phosphohydrolase, partial [Spirochaetaceae bacterium]
MSASNSDHSLIRNYLDAGFSNPIRDPLWGHIYLDQAMLELLHSAPLQQLNRIRQLGPTYLIYPGATHT